MLYEAIKPSSSVNNASHPNKIIKAEHYRSENESSTSKICTLVSPVNGVHNLKSQNEIKKVELQQNGNGISTNGVKKQIECSDSDDSDKDTRKSSATNTTSLSSLNSPSCSTSSNSVGSENGSTVHLLGISNNSSHKRNSTDGDRFSAETSSKEEFNKNVSTDSTHNLTKLVPYEVNDSSSSSSSEDSPPASNQRINDSNNMISTKAMVGTWQISPTHKVIGPSLQGHVGWKSRTEPVNELIRMSHEGYTAPVSTWNGNRAQLDRQIANERREERKRSMMDNADRGRIKHARGNNSSSFQYSNSGYNPFQVCFANYFLKHFNFQCTYCIK